MTKKRCGADIQDRKEHRPSLTPGLPHLRVLADAGPGTAKARLQHDTAGLSILAEAGLGVRPTGPALSVRWQPVGKILQSLPHSLQLKPELQKLRSQLSQGLVVGDRTQVPLLVHLGVAHGDGRVIR